MHEASLIRRVIEIAEEQARQVGASRITLIKVRIGEFRGVVGAALEFAFDVLRRGTMAEDARLEVETIPLRMRCERCGEYECPPDRLSFFCPKCSPESGDEAGYRIAIVSGRELEVQYIECSVVE